MYYESDQKYPLFVRIPKTANPGPAGANIIAEINSGKKLSDAAQTKLKDLLEEYKKGFNS